MKQKGFTLLELLIVISILGILASFVLVVFPSAQKRARDARRRSDVKQYQTSLEVYSGRVGSYPSGSGDMTSKCSALGLSGATCPDDPQALNRYQYQVNAAQTEYVIWTRLEDKDKQGNTQYYVVCSNGAAADVVSGIPPLGGNCPL